MGSRWLGTIARPGGRWVVGAVLWLASVAAPPTASSVDFVLIGNGTLQHLNWYGAGGSNCINQNSGTVWAVDGRVIDFRGTLDWTGQGKLDVVARVPLGFQSGVPICTDSWRAVNADDFPLEFAITNGDPAAFLRITPRLVGSVTQTTGLGGHPSTSSVTLIVRMTVSVNGQVVSQDDLSLTSEQVTGQSATWTPVLPKGDLNTVTIPGAAATGTQVTVDVFFYERLSANGTFSIIANSPYGNWLALLITTEPVGPLDVAEGPAPAALSLSIRPNPSPGRTRVSYTLPRSAPVELAVYDIRGARLATPVDRFEESGRHEVGLDAPSTRLGRLGPGIYLVELRAGAERRTAKLVVTE